VERRPFVVTRETQPVKENGRRHLMAFFEN